MRFGKLSSTLLASVALVALAGQAASAAEIDGSPGDSTAAVVAAVEKAVSGQSPSAAAAVPSSADYAASGTVEGVDLSIPRSVANDIGVKTANGPRLGITIPSVDQSVEGTVVKPGTVVYRGTHEGTDTVVQTLDDGGIRALVNIQNAGAPTEFRFPLSLPSGAKVRAVADGGLAITNSAGSLIGVVAAPWAKDSNGKAVPTSYRVDGTTIVQHVRHAGAAYPVIADPEFHWWGIVVTVSSGEANRISAALAIGAGISGIVASFAAGSIAGVPGAIVYGIAAGILGIGSGFVQYCNANGRGSKFIWAYVGGFNGCRSR